MKSIKPGRGPSMLGAIIAIAIAIFGILWVIMASDITSTFSGSPSAVNSSWRMAAVWA